MAFSPPYRAASLEVKKRLTTISSPGGCGPRGTHPAFFLKREAVIVPADSDVQSLEDIAGKQVDYTFGSSSNYTIVRALESVSRTLDDTESVKLAPSDVRAAFRGSSLDARVIWAPLLTSAVQELGARHDLLR